jgi:hypothetical protein
VVRRSNQPELDELSDQQRAAVLAGADALKTLADFRRRTFDEWMNVARGLAVLRHLADQRSARTAFKNLRRDHGYGSLNEATCTRLILMAKHETAIRLWRDSLTPRQRESWNSPTSICQRCSAVRAEMAKAPPRQPRKSGSADFEKALDTIQEAMDAADADARNAMAARLATLLSAFGASAAPRMPRQSRQTRGKKLPADNMHKEVEAKLGPKWQQWIMPVK